MGFMSTSLLAVLKSTEEWSVDGTIEITWWTLFSQVSFSFSFSSLLMFGLMALLTILVGLGYMLVYVCHASPYGSVSVLAPRGY